MTVDMVQTMLERLADELRDVQVYGRMAEQAEAAGYDKAAFVLTLIRRDEETHAAALHDILHANAPDALAKTMRDNPELAEMWHSLH